MKLILRQWPPTTLTDVGINMQGLHGALVHDTNDSASQQTLKSFTVIYLIYQFIASAPQFNFITTFACQLILRDLYVDFLIAQPTSFLT